MQHKTRVLLDLNLSRPARDERTDLADVHTRHGDAVSVHFEQIRPGSGRLLFGFSSAMGMEWARILVDFSKRRIECHTTDWRRAQPCHRAPLPGSGRRKQRGVFTLTKTAGAGTLVKMTDMTVLLDGEVLFRMDGIDMLPETGVALDPEDLAVTRFVHEGRPSQVPDELHIGGWQMPNVRSIPENLASLRRGIRRAADAGVQLLVTPETSLTGLFPRDRVTVSRKAIGQAEKQVRTMQQTTANAPFLVVGFPKWKRDGHGGRMTRYNVCRVYAPDGSEVSTHAKIHSCEFNFRHGYRLHEIDIHGVPACMHICHDGRYPELWTLPVMFGARLILHPCNGGLISGSIDAFEACARTSTQSSHAFYIRVNGGGGSYIAGPGKCENLIAASAECRRDSQSFPMVGPPEECLFHANVRIAEAFGYWPLRSFRASEHAAAGYIRLYEALGGRRWPDEKNNGEPEGSDDA